MSNSVSRRPSCPNGERTIGGIGKRTRSLYFVLTRNLLWCFHDGVNLFSKSQQDMTTAITKSFWIPMRLMRFKSWRTVEVRGTSRKRQTTTPAATAATRRCFVQTGPPVVDRLYLTLFTLLLILDMMDEEDENVEGADQFDENGNPVEDDEMVELQDDSVQGFFTHKGK